MYGAVSLVRITLLAIGLKSAGGRESRANEAGGLRRLENQENAVERRNQRWDKIRLIFAAAGNAVPLSLLFCFLIGCIPNGISAADFEFDLRWNSKLRQDSYSGRVYLFFTADQQKEPRLGPSWFHPEPFAAMDVPSWPAGKALRIGRSSGKDLYSFPRTFSDLQLAGYRVQAVTRFNPWDRRVGPGIGNAYSQPVTLPTSQAGLQPISLQLDQVVPDAPFPENPWCRLLKVRSRLLSEFHGREIFLQACVVLPASYGSQLQRRYPVILEVPGFGGTHLLGVKDGPVAEQNPGNVEFVRVTLDPSCPLGHHVFADSANNGPVGTALVTELIPHLEKAYRGSGVRFTTGHSSGGWSSLWLQVTYPDTFAGCWSTAPDPVDFRDFQLIDIYAKGANAFTDAEGKTRPLARMNGKPVLFFKPFSDMEGYMNRGGQLGSFEAVFSPKGADGRPQKLWDRKTGAIDIKVARAWEKYDIRLVLERNWKTLGPKLAGKIHVYMGDEDTFYLDGPARLLKQSLADLKSDAVVEMFPKRNHGNLVDAALRKRMNEEMAAAARAREKPKRQAFPSWHEDSRRRLLPSRTRHRPAHSFQFPCCRWPGAATIALRRYDRLPRDDGPPVSEPVLPDLLALLDAAPVPVFSFDRDARHTFVNAAGCGVMRKSRDQILGRAMTGMGLLIWA